MPVTQQTHRIIEGVRDAVAKILARPTNALTEAWARMWDQLRPGLIRAVADLLKDRIKWPSRKDIGNAAGWRAAIKAADTALGKLATLTRRRGADAVQDAVDAATLSTRLLIDSQYPRTNRPELPTASADELAGVVRRADGRLERLVKPIPVEVTRAMVQRMVRGTRIGSDPEAAISRIMRDLEGTFNGGLARVLTIVRTEVMDAHRAAAKAAQDATPDVLSGWIWWSRADAATCPACWALHGTAFPLSEEGPLDHPQGRCQRLPKVKTWRDLGFDQDEPDDQLPDPEQLFWALPEDVQIRILGRSRVELLKAGRIAWDDLATRRSNTGWRDSYAVTPLRDLKDNR